MTLITTVGKKMKELTKGIIIVEAKKNLHPEGVDKKKEKEEKGTKERTIQMQLAVVEQLATCLASGPPIEAQQ